MLDFGIFLIFPGQVKTDPPDKVRILSKPGHNKRRGTPPQQLTSPLTYIMLDFRIYLIFPGQLKTDPPDKSERTKTAEKVTGSHAGSVIRKGCTVDNLDLRFLNPISQISKQVANPAKFYAGNRSNFVPYRFAVWRRLFVNACILSSNHEMSGFLCWERYFIWQISKLAL